MDKNAHNERVLAKFPRTRARFGLNSIMHSLHRKGAITLRHRNPAPDAKKLSFEEWRAAQPLRLEED